MAIERKPRSFDHLDSDSVDAGVYRITTVNGSVYEVTVDEDGSKPHLLVRMANSVAADPTIGLPSRRLFADGEPIELLHWSADLGAAGARFVFSDVEARILVPVERYTATYRWTSAVVSIEEVLE